MVRRKGLSVLAFAFVAALCMFQFVSADRFTSTSYLIDASVLNEFGGSSSSSSYQLESSGGENVVGDGAGGSYKVGMGYIAQLEKSLALTIQPSGLVAAYPLEEVTGTLLLDQSLNNNYGNMYGTLSSTTGKIGNSLSFNGSSQAVDLSNGTPTQLSSEGTVEAWVKSSTTSGDLAAVSKYSNFWLGLSNGKAAVYDWTSTTTTSDSTTIADGNWHHIAMTLDSGVTGGSTLYVDGVAKQTFIWTPTAQTGRFVIGGMYNGSSYEQYFNGAVDHVKIFNRILSADEIAAEYDAQDVGNTSGLSLGAITAGISKDVLSDVIVRTDASGYTLSVSQDHDLTNGSYTIPAISGTIASPAAWSEGATKGLGFTLTATNGTAIPGGWGSGANYAAFPGTATTFYTRTGLQSGDDYLTLRLKADVAAAQVATSTPYTNTITVVGTATP